MDPTYTFAKHFLETKYENLPSEAVEGAKKEIIDSIGVALAGASYSGVRELTELLRDMGGHRQSTIIASGGIKMPALFAAQINATMMHALDFDDSIHGAIVHPGCVIVPVCFALSEYRGGLTGKEFITAVALGADLIARLGQATKYQVSMVKAGWFYTSLYGYITAAAVASKILNSDMDTTVNAIGIAYQKTSGNQQAVIDGALSKRMGPGFASSGGILAALMAAKGITGAHNCIEGEYGLYNIYHRGGYDREKLLSGLGVDFRGRNPVIKRYPACRITHPFIDAAITLVKENDLQPEEITSITVYGGEAGYYLIAPLEVKSNPRNTVDAQFSVPWAVATAAVKRRFSIADITGTAINDPEVIGFAKKIRAEKDSSLTRHGPEPGKVEMVTSRGQFVKQVEYPTDGKQTWMSFSECLDKFRECAMLAAKPLPSDSIDLLIDLITNLESVDDIKTIINRIA